MLKIWSPSGTVPTLVFCMKHCGEILMSPLPLWGSRM